MANLIFDLNCFYMQKDNTTWKVILLIIVVGALGIGAKLLPFAEGTWISHNLSGLFYVTELCLILYLIFPDHSSVVLALAAFLITSLLEILQLWNPDFLEWVRSSFVGRSILGSTFSWLDYPYYLGGAILGVILLNLVRRKETG